MSKSVVPERRFVTVLFADIEGFTSLSESLDPEDVEDIINSIFRIFRKIIEDHGGYLDKFIGDAVMAVFGAPKSHSDDPRRAILSGLRMQNALHEFNKKHGLSLAIRIGINTGEVLWSSIAGEKPTVMGDAVNVAQRLESIGEPGKVFVSEKTKELAEEFFEFRSKGETRVKGRKKPVRVYEVSGEKSGIHVLLRGKLTTPFLEREREIKLLEQYLLSSAGNRKVGIVQVVGDAGLGKTRLSVEFLNIVKERFPDIEVTVVRGDALKQGSFYVVSRIIKEKLGVLNADELKEVLCKLLKKEGKLSEAEIRSFERIISDVVFPEKLTDKVPYASHEKINAIITLFDALFSGEEKNLVIIDDFHEIDEDSLKVLQRASSSLHNAAILFIFNTRKEFSIFENAHVIKLKPLSKNGIYSMTRSIFNLTTEKISPDLVNFVIEKTGGNPYYVEELLRFIQERNLYTQNPLNIKEEGIHLPETLKGLLTERIDVLPDEEKEVIKTAACIGKVFWNGIIDVVRGKPSADSLKILEEKGIIQKESFSIIENDTEYSFVHELYRDAVYSLLTKREKVKMHNIIAGILELYEENAMLLYDAAEHYRLAGELDKAKELFEKSGDLSMQKGNFRFALRCYNNLEESAEVLLKKAHALENLAEYNRALGLAEKGLKITEDEELRTRLKLRISTILESKGDFDRSLEILEGIVNEKSPILRAEALSRMAWRLFRLSRLDEAREKANMALMIAKRLNKENREVKIRMSHILNVLANIELKTGDVDDAYKHLSEAFNICKELNDKDLLTRILVNLGSLLMYRAEYTKASGMLNEALEYATETANRSLIAAIYNNLGLIYMELGNTEKALKNYQHALRVAINIGNKYMQLSVLINLGRACMTLKRMEDAVSLLEKAIEIARELNYAPYLALSLNHLAYIHYVLGNYKVAEKNIREAISIYREMKDTSSLIGAISTLLDILIERGAYEDALNELKNTYNSIKNLKEEDLSSLRLREMIILYLKNQIEKVKSLSSTIKVEYLGEQELLIFALLMHIMGREFTGIIDIPENKLKPHLKELLKQIIAFKKKTLTPPPFLPNDYKLLSKIILHRT